MTLPDWSLPAGSSQVIVLSSFVLLVVLDVVGADDATTHNTPREFFRWAMSRSPLVGWFLPFAVGVLVGHFFHPWQRPPLRLDWTTALGVLFAVWALVLLIGPLRRDRRGLLLIGMLAAAILWPAYG